jgi:hypothetical protein
MLVSVPADALQVSRLIPDTPAHEGVERDRADYKAILAMIADGWMMSEMASDWSGSGKTVP